MRTVHITDRQPFGAIDIKPEQHQSLVLKKITRRLSRRSAVVLTIAFAVLLSLPSLTNGLFFDDLLQKAFITVQLNQPNLSRPWYDLFYVCGSGGSQEVLQNIFSGYMPWWTALDLRIAFFRPISVLTHYLDYILWPDNPWIMHAHNLLWYIGILIGLSIYYRRIIKIPWLANLAFLIYCLDDARVDTVSWVAGRNTLITTFFSIYTLISFNKWRTSGWRAGAYITPVLFTICIFCSEGAISLFAHFFAFALFLDRAKPLKRIVSLVPMLMITLGWRLMYNSFGYGASGSRYYVDPIYTPIRFLKLLPERMLAVLSDLFYVPVNLFLKITGIEQLYLFLWSIAITLFLLLCVLIPLALRSREIGYWCTATLLICLIACTTESSTRLLMLCSISGSALISHCIALLMRTSTFSSHQKLFHRIDQSPAMQSIAYVSASILFTVHLLVSPAYAIVHNQEIRKVAQANRAHATLYPNGPEVEGKLLVIVNAPELYTALTTIPLYFEKARYHPSAIIFIGETYNSLEVSHPNPYTIHVRNSEGFFKYGFSTVFRDFSYRFEKGYKIQQLGIWITVEEITSDGRPKRISLKYPSTMQQHIVWASWQSDGYRLLDLPEIGSIRRIPKIDLAAFFRAHQRQPQR